MGMDGSKQATQNCYHMDWSASRPDNDGPYTGLAREEALWESQAPL